MDDLYCSACRHVIPRHAVVPISLKYCPRCAVYAHRTVKLLTRSPRSVSNGGLTRSRSPEITTRAP